MITLPAAEIRYADTGELLGKAHHLTLRLTVDTRGLTEALEHVSMAFQATGESARRLMTLLRGSRLETLRHQARRKGRPGWRSIPIPRPHP